MVDVTPIIETLLHADPAVVDKQFFLQLKRSFAKEQGLSDIPSNSDLLRVYHEMLKQKKIQPHLVVEGLLQKRGIRSQSGIVSVQVLTKPFWCPGKCIFCPNDFTMPKSYINTEPGAMRALLNNFDPIKQVYNRLLSLTLTGHKTDKIEMIVLGGTWDVYPDDYKEQFIKGLYDACNTFPQFYEKVQFDKDKKYSYTIDKIEDIEYPPTVEEALQINETASCRMIGLTLETRPEYVTDVNCQFWRRLGVTRLEMGVQSLYDEVLDANKRGHSVQQARDAMHRLRQYGFKMSVHMMPGLYGSNYTKDLDSFVQLYSDPFFKPDEIKFYPTSVIPNTELYELYQKGEYVPLDTAIIQKLIREVFLGIIPPYTRIKRLIRDIPSTEIVAGSSVTNLSQLTHDAMRKELKDTPIMQGLYGRLYGMYEVYDSIEGFLASGFLACHPDANRGLENKILDSGSGPEGQVSNHIDTFIIGKEPDVKQYRNFVSLDTRSREIRNRSLSVQGLPKVGTKSEQANLVIRQYRSSVGREYFMSFEDELGYLYGLLRLLLPDIGQTVDVAGLGVGTAMVRELHVYGQLASLVASPKIQVASNNISQHKGFGSQLVAAAEQIAQYMGYEKLSIIAGVGVKEYYRKLGYGNEGTYVVKKLLAVSD